VLFGHNGGISMERSSSPRAQRRSARLLPRAVSLLALPLLALGLGACGGAVSTGSFKGEAHAVAQRISDLQSDVTAANEQKICDEDFSRAARGRLSTTGSTCKQALKHQLGSIDGYELTVEKVAVNGDTATAGVQSMWAGKPRLATLTLVKEGGGWRVSGVE
jgi:hypothetical protein